MPKNRSQSPKYECEKSLFYQWLPFYVSEVNDSEGKESFHTLWLLAAFVLSLSHGNVELARGFSINKSLLSIHRYSTKDKTIVALRLGKDYH